ncbi:MAG: ATP-dependent Clp protease proteolytic subunit [Planctomycetota bacterium]|jgi:membrane-bound serine protease (ClpP class)|nr:ATP-dependent Clp protease proteolytic subunit [Planctomycetota bacterium]
MRQTPTRTGSAAALVAALIIVVAVSRAAMGASLPERPLGDAAAPPPLPPAGAEEVSWLDKVVAIPVTGAIVGKPFSEMADMVAAALAKAERDQARLIVLEIDSPGGEVGTCDTLSRKIFELKVPALALVLHKAVSGGAMLATAAREIIMTRSARLGDIQPMQASITGAANAMDDRTAEKIEVDIRTIMKVFAEHYGRPVAVVEAMVSRSSSLYQVSFEGGKKEYLTGHELELLESNIEKRRDSRRIAGSKILKPEGKLLELSAPQAVEYGLASEMVESAEAFYTARGIDKEDLVRPKIVEGEIDLKKLIPSMDDLGLPVWVVLLLGVFLVVGVAGVITEYHAPGSGIPIAIGIIGFACFFSTLLMFNRGSPVGIALFLIGMGMLVVEIMVLPGFGVTGILGIVGIIAGLFLAFTPEWGSAYMTRFLWHEVGSFTLLLFLGMAAVFAVIWVVSEHGDRLPIVGRLFLTQVQTAGVNPNPETVLAPTGESRRELARALIGQAGTAETALRPAGKVRLDSGAVADVVTDGGYIEAGRRVIVWEAVGNRVLVAPEEKPRPRSDAPFA